MGARWLEHYENDMPEKIEVPEQSVFGLMEPRFKKFADHTAFTFLGATYSYRQMDELSKQFASYLHNTLGLKKGDRVAIMLPNCSQYPIALYGTLRAGMVVVNVNPLYTDRELAHQLSDSGTETIVILKNFASTLQQALPQTPIKNVIVTELGDMLPFPKGLVVNFVLKHVRKMVPAYSLPSPATTFKSALAKGKSTSQSFRPPEITPEDIAFLQYTGGTTGVAKGAVLTHRNIVANITQATTWIRSLVKEGEEIIITALPLYHIFSLTANCLTFGYFGGNNVLIPNPRDLKAFIGMIKDLGFTAFTGVNTLFNGLLNQPEFCRDVDFSRLKVTLGGGMAVQESVANRWQNVTGCFLNQAYGLTETSPAACINPMKNEQFNGSIGFPIPSTEVSIRDNDGNELDVGDKGELWIRGPQVMRGYWNNEEETANVLTADKWFKTGDVAMQDDQGYIFLVDRIKEMILVSGFNVYPTEVDEVMSAHPKILEAAVVGVDDAKSGEAIKLFVVKKDPTLTEEEIRQYAKDNLTGYKRPKYVVFAKELPKTNVGKILRRALK